MPGGQSKHCANQCDLQIISAQETFQNKPSFVSLAWGKGIISVMTPITVHLRDQTVLFQPEALEGDTLLGGLCNSLAQMNLVTPDSFQEHGLLIQTDRLS